MTVEEFIEELMTYPKHYEVCMWNRDQYGNPFIEEAFLDSSDHEFARAMIV